MSYLQTFFTIMLMVQILHFIEECVTNLPRYFPLFNYPLKRYLTFEIIFTLFWLAVLLAPNFPQKTFLLSFFLILMFVVGVWHVSWSLLARKYMPGLITACFFIATFIVFYFLPN